jgi:hypothetical protein
MTEAYPHPRRVDPHGWLASRISNVTADPASHFPTQSTETCVTDYNTVV